MKNNPLNIRQSNTKFIGEKESTNAFKDFITIEFGYRAAFRNINTYISQYKVNTLEGIINRWAPPNENDTQNYIKFVCEKTGFDRQKQFIKSDTDLIPMVYAMSWIENGIKSNYRQVEIGYKLINVQSVNEGITIINDLQAI